GSAASCAHPRRRQRRLANAPPRQPVDRDEDRERRDQHHERERGRAGVVELLELRHDQERRDLGLHRHVAAHEHDGAVLAERACEYTARFDVTVDANWSHVSDDVFTITIESGIRTSRLRYTSVIPRLSRNPGSARRGIYFAV